VIGKRLKALISNLKRCEIDPVAITQLDVKIFGGQFADSFDLVIADVPCTGQSLPLKGIKNPGCFHPRTIEQNANRQKRIIANAAKAVRPGGYLAYMTCTYSMEENEGVIDWFLKRFATFEPVAVETLEKNQSHLRDYPCYRMWPQTDQGAGSFTILLKKMEEPVEAAHYPEIPFLWQSANFDKAYWGLD